MLRVAVAAATAISKEGAATAQSQFNATDLRPKPPKPEVVAKPLGGALELLETETPEP